MKWTRVVLFLLLLAIANAQVPDLAVFQKMNETVVIKFNSEDYKGIYELGGDYYKTIKSEASLIADLRSVKRVAGEIVSTELLEDLGKVKHFKWVGKNKTMKFELWMEGSQVVLFKFNDFIRQPSESRKPILTDNPLKTNVDLAVHKYATIYMSDPKAVGLSVGVFVNGKKYAYNYGELEKGSGRLPTGNTFYSLGSVSKVFTGLLLAKAVTEKKVSLQDDVRKYLKGDYPNLAFNGQPVRLIHLANHTGIPVRQLNSRPPDFDSRTEQERFNFYYEYPRSELLKDLERIKLTAEPGSKYYYSTGGIALLAMVLESVYGKTFDQMVREYYGKTFGMKNTKSGMSNSDMKRYAKGYDAKGELQPTFDKESAPLPHVNSTTNDMLKFIEVNVAEKDEAIKLSHQPTYGDLKSFALGLVWEMRNTYEKGRGFWHSGFDPGYISLCSFYPEKNMGFILLATDDSRQNNLYDMERNIMHSLEVGK